MKKLLTDIELDFYELKCLLEYLDKSPEDKQLFRVTARSLVHLSQRVEKLREEFGQHYVAPASISEAGNEPSPLQELVVEETEKVLDEAVEAAPAEASQFSQAEELEPLAPTQMYRALSLNDVFRYSRELFSNDTSRLKAVMGKMEELGAYEQAIAYLAEKVDCNLDAVAYQDMDDFLKAYFKN